MVDAAAQDPAGYELTLRQQHRLKNWGIKANLVGVPGTRAQRLVDQAGYLMARYPEAAKVWRSLGPDRDASRLTWDQVLGYRDGDMRWSPPWMRLSDGTFDRMLAGAVRRGVHPPGCGTVEALMTHEFGHVVEEAVERRLAHGQWMALTQR